MVHSSSAPSEPLILPHQQAAFNRLVEIGTACFAIQRDTLPIKPTTPTLLIAPTGSGKTYLARAVAERLEAQLFTISASDWIVLGSSERGAETTWISIANFLYRHRNATGIVILLDEGDKLTGHQHTSSWDLHVMVECFQLLDLRLPSHLKDGDGEIINGDRYRETQETLANRVFIITTGAFQSIWDSLGTTSIGFGLTPSSPILPGYQHLLQILPREYLNRFRQEVLFLNPLQLSDYLKMLEATASRMPSYLRQTFLQIGRRKIPEAFSMQQGCRFLGDITLDTILEERSLLRQSIAPASP